MTKVMGIYKVYYAKNLVLVLQITECVLVLAVVAWLTLYYRILHMKNFCHPNLRLLLVLQPFSHCCTLLLRLLRHTMDACDLLTSDIVDQLNLFTDIGLVTATMLMLALSIERLIATIMARKYEKMCQKVPWLSIILFLIVVTYAFLQQCFFYAGYYESWKVYVLMACLFSIATVFFAILPLISRRKFAATAHAKTSTISERYQTNENVKSAHLLKYVSAYKSLTNFLSLSFYIIFFETLEGYYIPLASEVYFFFNIFQLTCQMFLTIMSHCVLRDQLYRIIGKTSGNVDDQEQGKMRSLTGKQMMFTAAEERDRYFQMYANTWDVVRQPETRTTTTVEKKEETRRRSRTEKWLGSRQREYTVEAESAEEIQKNNGKREDTQSAEEETKNDTS